METAVWKRKSQKFSGAAGRGGQLTVSVLGTSRFCVLVNVSVSISAGGNVRGALGESFELPPVSTFPQRGNAAETLTRTQKRQVSGRFRL
ncbi:hypothetical protein ACIPJG_33410 [Streptomyces halstedii]|uniref:hypothetical protein n=1 Tax=Streptomyces halstedii TaxID=1944 RepID=UPI0037F4492C